MEAMFDDLFNDPNVEVEDLNQGGGLPVGRTSTFDVSYCNPGKNLVTDEVNDTDDW